MKVPVEFDEIRPFEPEELPQVFDRLLANTQFRQVLNFVMPGVPFDMIEQKMHECKTNLDFQLNFCYGFLQKLVDKYTGGCSMDVSNISNSRRYTFVSNHRDIVIDPAFLGKGLIDNGFNTTCEIAIGDNLLSLPWVKDLVRIDKSFIVRRGLPPRETLAASKLMSDYMYFVIEQKHDNIWIAQREGRAKDSDDRTQPAILKMMAMGGGKGSVTEKLKRMHIVPLSISYEYDPCDFLKAQEFQLKRDIEGWKKSAQDDVVSMQTGIVGYKGRVHYQCAPCIDEWLDTLDPEMPKTKVFDVIAAHIDHEIHRNYRIYPSNYVALDLLDGGNAYAGRYTAEDKATFEKYLDGQMAKINIENKDEAYLRERMLTMYANPARNFIKASE
ncbi:1-acyl-sn-glycerol-3-phosphate acyltransferase [uncultured Prevotella sp.]|uniref:1-acyl-sn-glycerol-3-phosphate acyltransferase n=1 Tax=uncultured Prevotella sp. TaxID=159272 RepID=UPI002618F6C2|nr:1-acyl-sn-glycerol-3-phosphate acyltransferase [uncultured Prevotella sp.]